MSSKNASRPRWKISRVALAFAYDGTRFDSFAQQPKRRTVEGELLGVLRRSGAFRSPHSARFEVASRTDKHVSAAWNVCAFDSGAHPLSLVHAKPIPEGLHLLTAVRVAGAFSPRRAAVQRTYRYWISDPSGIAWHRMRGAARLFEGEHDFRNFCRPEPGFGTVRRVDHVRVVADKKAPHIQVEAANFLWEQVRRMVHALFDAGRGRRTLDSLRRQLEGHPIRPEPPAPAQNLLLERVELPVRFPPPSQAVARRIRAHWMEAAARARLYAGLAARVPTARR